MEILFIAVGVLVAVALLVWGFSALSDPAEVDQEEAHEVSTETSKEHKEALAHEHVKTVEEENKEDEELYSLE